jgi:hypothetical protein
MSMAQRVRAESLQEPDWPEGSVDAGLSDHRYWLGEAALSDEAYGVAVRDLAAWLADADAGAGAADRWRALRERLGVTVAAPCLGQPEPFDPPGDAVYARLATDLTPDLGDLGPRTLLGDSMDELDRFDPFHRRAVRNALAATAFTIPMGETRTPLRAWLQDNQRPPREHLDPVRVAARAPYAPWRLSEADGGWRLAPILPVADWWVPSQVLPLSSVGGVWGGPVDQGLLFARIVPGPSGIRVIAGLALPEVPPWAWWRGLLARHLAVVQAENRSLRFEDVLRRLGHRLCAEAHTWAYCRAAGQL